ncbi:hypothetical protein [Massilia glaciei]|uniref:MarR family transcriptional regulator n=1 Tax=Massilia glaciei TaxID=1524097 RepID=A0A2U2HGD2_9BURK|nr:hypothetical protein [Massilia glaciei]PWF43997.1 hypothetical protein C7C56_020120 [Massilia glaciei]
MSTSAIPDDVKRFILVSIHSVPYLEAMLLLRNEASAPWDSKRLSQRLYVSEKVATVLLAQLCGAGVLESADRRADLLAYAYKPNSEELGEIIDRLTATYAKNLVDVTNLIHSRTDKKAQAFANAFVWRKDP